jgi:hypothetical protein
MCTETVQVSLCNCSVILRHTCAFHIAHTHKQIDNAPCPKFHRKVISGGSRCRPGRCPAKKDRFYTFETVGESLFEHFERIDRQWRQERCKRERERLAREERIKEESGGGLQRLKRVKRGYSQEVKSSVKMEEDEDFFVKAEHEDAVYSDLEDEDEDGMREQASDSRRFPMHGDCYY